MKPPGRIIGVIQARMGSTRLPGKMMMPLGGHTLIEWVLTRMRRATQLDQIVLATSADIANDPIVEIAERLDFPTIRGEEEDVLGRFIEAGRRFQADYVVRVCGDNPFIAPEEIDRLVSFYFHHDYEYVFNHLPNEQNAYPDGLCAAEILSMDLLSYIDSVAKAPRYREHVTIYLHDHSDQHRMSPACCPSHLAFPWMKLDIDTAEDMARLEKLVVYLNLTSSAESIVESYLHLFKNEI